MFRHESPVALDGFRRKASGRVADGMRGRRREQLRKELRIQRLGFKRQTFDHRVIRSIRGPYV
jgi:hypothetical protein